MCSKDKKKLKCFWGVFILILFVCSSCNISKKDNGLISYPILPNSTVKWNLPDVIDSCFYVKLKITDSTLLGNIYKIEVADSIIAVLDDISNSLQVYSIEGEPVGVIFNPGMGPGEYVQLSDFVLSEKEQSIRILDAMQSKMVDYSLTGEFVKEIKMPFNTGVSCFAKMDEEVYIFDQKLRRNPEEWKYDILLLSESFTEVRKLRPYREYSDITLASRRSFNRVNDTLTFFPTYNDTLFSIVGGNFIPRYKLDFGDYWYDYDYLYDKTKNPQIFIEGLKNTNFIYFINVLETSSHIWLDFCFKERYYHTVINKSNSKVSTYFRDDDECRFFYGLPLATWNDFFVIPVKPDYMNREYGIEVSEDDNPYLLFVKFY